ncbi:MAG: terminase family protein [Phycisphaerae bacterium]
MIAAPEPSVAAGSRRRTDDALRLLPYQQRALTSSARFTWNNWSRQSGKSFTFTLRRILRGLARHRNQLLLSAGERQSRELMRTVQAHCLRLAVVCELRGHSIIRGMRFHRLEARLPNGVRILALPANPMTARGFTADVFLDEFAMHHDDRAIWAALMPTLLRGEGELDVASTPRGRGNMFHRLGGNPRFATSTVTLRDAIAQGLDADEATVRATMDDEQLFRQEFLCEFDADADAYLSHELIVSCVDTALDKTPDEALLSDRRAELFVGIDVGRIRDLTVIWIWQHSGGCFITRGVITLKQRPFHEQRAAIERVLEHRAVRRACIDATGLGMSLAEDAVRAFGAHRVEAVTFTPAVQSEMASRLRAFAESGRLRIPADETIHNDWHGLKRFMTASGHVRYRADHTGAGHSDRFWAAALGLHAAAEAVAGPADYAASGPMRFARTGTW